MQRSYEAPELSVILLQTSDVMTNSLTNGGDDGEASLSFSLRDEFLA